MGLVDVLPSNPRYSTTDCISRESEIAYQLSNRDAFRIQGSKRTHHRLGENSPRVILSVDKRWPGLPIVVPFGVPVCHVVLMCADEEMSRITTRRIVTMVEDLESVWDWAIHQLPNCTVRKCASESDGVDTAVPQRVSGTKPFSAAITFRNVCHYALFNGARPSRHTRHVTPKFPLGWPPY